MYHLCLNNCDNTYVIVADHLITRVVIFFEELKRPITIIKSSNDLIDLQIDLALLDQPIENLN